MPPDHYHNYATILSYTPLQLKCQGWIFVKLGLTYVHASNFSHVCKACASPAHDRGLAIQQFKWEKIWQSCSTYIQILNSSFFFSSLHTSCHWRLLYITLKPHPFHYCPINNPVNKLRPLTTLLHRQRQLISWADPSVNTSMLLVQSPSNQI